MIDDPTGLDEVGTEPLPLSDEEQKPIRPPSRRGKAMTEGAKGKLRALWTPERKQAQRERFKANMAKGRAAKSSGTRRTSATAAKRVSLADGIGALISVGGSLLVRTEKDPPVGRALMLEAPIAGERLDVAIAGTPLDKAIQRIARAGKDLEGASAVLLLPLMVAVIERRPESMALLAPVFRSVLVEMLVELDQMNKRPKPDDEAKANRMVQELELGVDLDDFMNKIFTGEEAPSGAQPQPAAAAA